MLNFDFDSLNYTTEAETFISLYFRTDNGSLKVC